MSFPKRHSLLLQLVSRFSIISLVTIGLAAIGTYWYSRYSLELSILQRLNHTIDHSTQELNGWLERQFRDTLQLSEQSEIRSNVARLITAPADGDRQAAYDRLRQYFDRTTKIKPNLRKIRITHNSGFVVFCSDKPSVEKKFLPLGFPATNLISEDFNEITPNFYLDDNQIPTITFVVPLTDFSGIKMAALSIDLNIQELSATLLATKNYVDTQNVFLIGQNNLKSIIFLSTNTNKSRMYPSEINYFSKGIQQTIAQRTGMDLYQNSQQNPVVGVYRWLPKYNLGLLTEIDQKEAFAAADHLATMIILVGCLASGVLILAIYCLSRHITQPILAISKAAEQLAQGDLNQSVSVTAKNEVGILAQTFNMMAAQLKLDVEILEQRVAERTVELVTAQHQAEFANKSKSEFLANMSHELRTPLNAILGLSEALQDGIYGLLNDRQNRSITIIEKSGQHLLELINDILDVSKIEAGKMELNISSVMVEKLCQSSLHFVEQLAQQKQIKLNSVLPTAEINVLLDEFRLRQALINLLNNAIKFTKIGGKVTLTVYFEPTTPDLESYICFSIADTGIGIAAADCAKLFQPFVQVDSSLSRKYEGTGLGLMLVKQIAELHGGSVTLESEIGQGSCFTIRLPCRQAIQMELLKQ